MFNTKTFLGGLYLRMVKCLYRAFTIRKDIPFVNSEFVQVMRSVGNLALKTLLSNRYLLQKSEVIEIAGEFAFEYGFFAGHEDFRLCTDPTDIYITYVHRSLEEFFGSFGFIQALNDGKCVDDILGSDCENPIFMTNPLVLKFCLWLLSHEDMDDCYEKQVSYAVNFIDNKHLGPNAIPESLRKILEKCRHISIFLFIREFDKYIDGRIVDKTDRIFGSMNKEVLDKLALVSIGDYVPYEDCPKANALIISINTVELDAAALLDILLNKYNLRNRNPEVYLREKIRNDCDISTVTSENIKELHLWTDDYSTLTASGEIPFCPLLTSLKLEGFEIDPSVPSTFRKAVNDGRLPNLRRIELSLLSKNAADWPEVPELCCETNDLTLSLPDQSDVQKLLSQLTHLTVQSPICTRKCLVNIDRLLTKQLTKLSVLKLIEIDMRCFSKLMTVLNQGKLPNLSELFVLGSESFNENPNLFDFTLKNFQSKHTPHLEKVSLRRCIMSADELRILSDRLSSCHFVNWISQEIIV